VSPGRAPTALADGAWHFQAKRWETGSLLVVAGGEALVADPSFAPQEIQAIKAEADRRAGRASYLLVTHSHFDHTCGIGQFPEATVVAGSATAEVIETGAAAAQLQSAAEEWGMRWPAELRVDRAVASGVEVSIGPFRIRAIEASGNTLDGTAFLLLDQGILIAGDFLGSVIYPFLEGPPALARATVERLLAALDESEVRWIVPGHGPALSSTEARAVGEADVIYLDRLEETARSAVANRASSAEALLQTYAVDPPRRVADDFAMYSPRVTNARRALQAAGLSVPSREETSWRLFGT
jgi:glyoxylase-like metal-dependent hydrolase (beta-lactamase superfamily II)